MSNGFDQDVVEAGTMRGQDWPCLRQFCVFLENRVGQLRDVMQQLETADNRVMAVTIVDSVDFAIARIVFSNTDVARERLELAGFPFSENDVVGVELPAEDKPFTAVCTQLMKAEINIHHSYPLLYRRKGRGAVVLSVDDVDQSIAALKTGGLTVLTEGDLLDDDEYL